MVDSATRPASLSEIAGRQISLLAGATVPLFVAAGILLEGPARWVLIGLGVIIGSAPLFPQDALGRRKAPVTLVSAVLTIVVFGWLAADFPPLVAATLTAQTVYTSLMVPRRWAVAGLVLLPAIYALLPVWHGFGPAAVLSAAAVAVTVAAVGALLLRIRIITERRATEHSAALAAVNNRLEVLNRRDPLTGLANRRTLDETLAAAWADGQATGRPVGFIMIDIDHFKRYNDHYGHPAGDACLRLVAATLADSVRGATDVVVRYGGEEFAVILPGVNLLAAYDLAERIRSAVVDLRQEHAASPDGHLSISVGAASATPGPDSPEELIRAADQALYGAKRHGRNCVYV
ncbi:MAG: diguanylate cyclase [Actinoplanes sp.]